MANLLYHSIQKTHQERVDAETKHSGIFRDVWDEIKEALFMFVGRKDLEISERSMPGEELSVMLKGMLAFRLEWTKEGFELITMKSKIQYTTAESCEALREDVINYMVLCLEGKRPHRPGE